MKLRRQKITVDQVYDLMALRILTDSVKNCYAHSASFHKPLAPIPGRIKGFHRHPAAQPLPVAAYLGGGAAGQTFEVQIRTEEMHRIAEEGIAAHWKYKEGPQRAGGRRQPHRPGCATLVENRQRDMQVTPAILMSRSGGPLPGRAYTFTPKGKVIVLPRESHAHRFRPTPFTPTWAIPVSAPRSTAALFRCARNLPQRRHRRDRLNPARATSRRTGLAGLRPHLTRRAIRSST